jgi:hypothetical protein
MKTRREYPGAGTATFVPGERGASMRGVTDIVTEAELRRRGRLLFTVLTVIGLRWSSREPELVQALRGWLGSWERTPWRAVQVAAWRLHTHGPRIGW